MEIINQLIDKLNLEPHPEGGYFKETYRSAGVISSEELGIDYDSERNISTCIYFLLTSEIFSAFHKIKQDEFWHFYSGSPISLQMISENGQHKEVRIGSDILNGQVPQFVVPGGGYFAASVIEENSYALVGCTVAPGFDFRDFTLPSRKELLDKFPEYGNLIKAYTRIS